MMELRANVAAVIENISISCGLSPVSSVKYVSKMYLKQLFTFIMINFLFVLDKIRNSTKYLLCSEFPACVGMC